MGHKALQRLAGVVAPGLGIAAAQVGQHPRPRAVIRAVPFPALLFVNPMNVLGTAAVPQKIRLLFVQLRKRRCQRKACGLCNSAEHRPVPRCIRIVRGKPPFIKGKRTVRHNQVAVVLHFLAQPRAVRAGTIGIVEGKKPRLQLRNGNAAVRAGIFLGKKDFLFDIVCIAVIGSTPCIKPGSYLAPRFISPVHAPEHNKYAVRALEHRFHGICKALADSLFQHNAVNNNFDCMLLLLVQLDRIIQLHHQPVDARAHKTGFPCIVQHLLVLAFFAADNGRKQRKLCPFGPGKHRADNLVNRLLLYFAPAFGAVRGTNARVQQAVVVVNFRHRAYRRARILVRSFLFNGNGGGKPRNQVNVGLVHAPQKLAGVR